MRAHELTRGSQALDHWRQHRLDYGRFNERIMGGRDYDVGGLTHIFFARIRSDLEETIRRAFDGFRPPSDLTEAERVLAGDEAGRNDKKAEALIPA
jgi:hypothetical protein